MAVFRVERTNNYTVMSNYHLRDKTISFKAKGLLSMMLSLPENWDYTLAGLARISLEGKDAIRAAVVELEKAGYDDTFRMAQEMVQKRIRKRGNHPALCLTKLLRCGVCGNSLRRISERQWRHTLRFHCDGCGMSVTIPDADLLSEVERQAAEYTPPADAPGYTPSEDTVRLTNAINRGLEKPEHPEEVTALIMQGISARYACFPTQMASTDILRLIREKGYDQANQTILLCHKNVQSIRHSGYTANVCTVVLKMFFHRTAD